MIVNNCDSKLNFFYDKNLHSKEGRLFFIENKVKPIVQKASELQKEMQELAAMGTSFSIQAKPADLLHISQKTLEKMNELAPILLLLEALSSMDQDFLELEEILKNSDSLSLSKEMLLDRIQKYVLDIENFLENRR